MLDQNSILKPNVYIACRKQGKNQSNEKQNIKNHKMPNLGLHKSLLTSNIK